MLKKPVALVLTFLFLVSLSPLTAQAASEPSSAMPRALLSTSAYLSSSGTNLCMYVRFLHSSAEMTYYNVALQQYSGGEWKTWASYSDIRNEQVIIFEKYASPPGGYWYRLKVTGSSTSFPNFEFYSNELYR